MYVIAFLTQQVQVLMSSITRTQFSGTNKQSPLRNAYIPVIRLQWLLDSDVSRMLGVIIIHSDSGCWNSLAEFIIKPYLQENIYHKIEITTK
jgi:hypothetical protein